MTMNMSNVILSLRNKSGPSQTLSVDVNPASMSAGRFKIQPKATYNVGMVTSSSFNSNGALVLGKDCDINEPAFDIGGVKILNKRYTQSNNLTSMVPTAAQDNVSSDNRSLVKYQSKKPTVLNTSNHKDRGKSAKVLLEQTIKLQSSKLMPYKTKGTKLQNLQSRHLSKENVRPHHHRSHQTNSKYDTYNPPTKVRKKQSPDIQSSVGATHSYPSAPPGTPSSDMKKMFNYIPSLSDNLAKQQVKSKLKVMKQVESVKEKSKQLEKQRNELKEFKEREQEYKRQQRRIIYILNNAMTIVENEQFEKFKRDNGLRPKEYPSPFTKR